MLYLWLLRLQRGGAGHEGREVAEGGVHQGCGMLWRRERAGDGSGRRRLEERRGGEWA